MRQCRRAVTEACYFVVVLCQLFADQFGNGFFVIHDQDPLVPAVDLADLGKPGIFNNGCTGCNGRKKNIKFCSFSRPGMHAYVSTMVVYDSMHG